MGGIRPEFEKLCSLENEMIFVAAGIQARDESGRGVVLKNQVVGSPLIPGSVLQSVEDGSCDVFHDRTSR